VLLPTDTFPSPKKKATTWTEAQVSLHYFIKTLFLAAIRHTK